ncbi:MAG: hypothetical protein ACRER2_05520 [Methylococcales bacterium]
MLVDDRVTLGLNIVSMRAGWLAAIFLFFFGTTAMIQAQPASQANQALRKAQGMLRQLASEKKALEAKNAELEAELAKKNVEISQILEEVTKQQSVCLALQQNNAMLVERIKSDNGKIQDMIAKYRTRQEEIKLYQHDHVLLQNALVERDEWISNCRTRNSSLLAQGKDLLLRYNEKSLWDSFVGEEPVLGIGKVDQETRDQEYRFKLEDLEVQAPDAGALPLQIKQGQSPPKPKTPGEQSQK